MPGRQASGWCRAARDRGALGVLARCPWVVPVLLVPSWVTWLTVERDLHDTNHPLFYHIPDLTRDPLAVLINLTITPLVNTETDQIILITVLIGAGRKRSSRADKKGHGPRSGTRRSGASGFTRLQRVVAQQHVELRCRARRREEIAAEIRVERVHPKEIDSRAGRHSTIHIG